MVTTRFRILQFAGIIDHQELQRLCGIPDQERFKEEYRQWVGAALTGGSVERESSWTESVAVGSRKFVEEVKVRLGIKAIGRKIREQGETLLTLRERSAAYNADFGAQKGGLSLQNS
jgi:putative transposase